jgi:hypothetical protein
MLWTGAWIAFDGTANKKGAIAGWRMTGMFLRDAEGWAKPNWNCGWYLEDVHTLRAAVHNATSTRVAASVNNDNGNGNGNDFGQSNKSDNNHNAAAEGDFDVFVFRIPSPGWIPISAITIGKWIVWHTKSYPCDNAPQQQ